MLAFALVASRGCASRETDVSREDAVEIAREEVEYEPDRVMTKFLPRGFRSRPTWAVSLATLRADGTFEQLTVVVVDGRTGDVLEIKRR